MGFPEYLPFEATASRYRPCVLGVPAPILTDSLWKGAFVRRNRLRAYALLQPFFSHSLFRPLSLKP